MNEKELKINSTKIYDGKVVDLYIDDVLCPNGNKAKREVVRHHGGVCILGFIDNCVVMEKQYRYSYDEFILELPAGKLEPGENPLEAGIREFEEETGYKPLHMIDLGEMYPSCGYCDEKIYLYFADKITKTHNHLDEDEFLEIILMPLDEVLTKIKNNEIKDAKTICLIQKYLLLNEVK